MSDSGSGTKAQPYSGYVSGDTPRKVMMNGREYPVEYIVYRNKTLNLETNDYEEIFKLKLKSYGVCDIFYKHGMEKWKRDELEEPGKPFSEEF